jgi:uncharacterized protein (DUF305 family)
MTSAPPFLGPPRRRALILGALVAVFALAVGYLGGMLQPRLSIPGDNSPEAGFARDMSVHHAQAVEMAMIAWQKSKDPNIQEMAYNIATGQQAQIGIMQTWLVDWHLLPTGTRPRMAWMPDHTPLLPDGRMPGMASDAELAQLHSLTGTPFDVLFCQLMLRHHLGGIHMVEGLLQVSHNKQVTDLAAQMKTAQQNDVTNLHDLLTQFKADPLPS